MASRPTRTMTARRTVGGSRMADLRAEQAAEGGAQGDQCDGGPVEGGDEEEEDRRDTVDAPDEDVLEGVEALQVLVEQQAHEGHVDHALGGAEVAAVDAGEEQRQEQEEAAVGVGGGAVTLVAGSDPGGERGLGDDEDEGDGDQRGDDYGERLGWQCQQQDRAAQASQEGDAPEAQQTPAAGRRAHGGSRRRR